MAHYGVFADGFGEPEALLAVHGLIDGNEDFVVHCQFWDDLRGGDHLLTFHSKADVVKDWGEILFLFVSSYSDSGLGGFSCDVVVCGFLGFPSILRAGVIVCWGGGLRAAFDVVVVDVVVGTGLRGECSQF